jgi:hypothetical protein
MRIYKFMFLTFVRLNTTLHLKVLLKPVYKGHSREPENVAFMSSCPLYTGLNYMHYSLIGKMRLPFIDSDLLYRVALYDRLDCILKYVNVVELFFLLVYVHILKTIKQMPKSSFGQFNYPGLQS